MAMMIRTAELSTDGLYRYRLGRRWGHVGPPMVFVMLNPSTADAMVDDPTIRRCIGFAKREGYNAIEVLNLFALRTTKPVHLLHHPYPDEGIPGYNNFHWGEVLADEVGPVVAAWGGSVPNALSEGPALRIWRDIPHPWVCLGMTQDGAPRHPLYVRKDAPLRDFGTVTTVMRPGRMSNHRSGEQQGVEVKTCVVAGCPNAPTGKTVTIKIAESDAHPAIVAEKDICDDCLATMNEPVHPIDFSFGFRGYKRDPREVDAQ